jgi:CheY-like chemotaxis protein
LDLNVVIESLKPMLRRLLGGQTGLVTSVEADLWSVKADPTQIEQVILNLAVNARDAMTSDGELRITTSNLQEAIQPSGEAQPDLIAGQYVVMTISDTGGGIDETTRSHIFGPFFSTKGFGKGSGLGLSTVYGIVKQSGGHITVESEVGLGTTFKIYLPRADSPASVKSVDRVQPAAAGVGVVLLAEDEDSVRRLARAVLESGGYTVLEAQDGIDALKVIEEQGGRINVLLTDVIMPRMGGRELADRLLKAYPEARVVYMSGYTDDAMIPQDLVSSGTLFVHKPFSPETLLNTIREALSPQ